MLAFLLAALACNLPLNRAPDSPGHGGTVTDPSADADNDGYDAPLDCDDSDPAIHPGTKEWCGNGRDDNCNGTSDDCDWSGDYLLEGRTIASDEAWSAFGSTLSICDANGDGQLDVVTSAYGANDYAGGVYVFYGPVETDRTAETADYSLAGTEIAGLGGWATACRGDVTGDGKADLVIGEPSYLGSKSTGAMYVVPGGDVGSWTIADASTSTWTGMYAGEGLGYSAIVLDADGDETDDIAVSSAGALVKTNEFGTTYLIDDARPGTSTVAAASAYIIGTEGDELWATAGNAGDLDGDGLEELAVPGRGSKATDAVFLFRAPFAGAIAKADADVRIDDHSLGFGATGLGHADVDQDGTDDLLVGNPFHAGRAGAAYVFYGDIVADTTTTAADVQLYGAISSFDAGSAIVSPGDIDGDGKGEMLVGASLGSAVYLQYGGEPGVYDLEKDSRAAWWLEQEYSLAGDAVAAGDVTGDGVTDLAIGAPGFGDAADGAIFLMTSFEL